MIGWIADRWIAVSDWVAMRAGELWAWLRAVWRRFTVWLTIEAWEGVGCLFDLFRRED